MKVSKDVPSSCYAIKNTSNNKLYIGVSNNMQQRIYSHISGLRNGKHPNRNLQIDYDKHGETLEYYELEDGIEFKDRSSKELEWILELESHFPNKGYNLNDKRVEKHLNGPEIVIIQGVPDID